MSNKIWRSSAGKRGESPAISGAAGPVTAIIDFTRIVGDEGRVLRAVRAGLIVAGGSAGSILGGPSNRSRTLVGGLSLVKKDRALELGWVEIKPRPRDSCQEESPSAEHQLRSNGPGDQRPAACIENVENQCSPKNRCLRGSRLFWVGRSVIPVLREIPSLPPSSAGNSPGLSPLGDSPPSPPPSGRLIPLRGIWPALPLVEGLRCEPRVA
jgi:hypothetical protein